MTPDGPNSGAAARGRWLASLPLAAALAFVGAFVVAPVVWMFGSTFFVDGEFTLAAWTTVLASDVERTQLWNSISLGVVATAIATVLGVGHAFATTSTDLPLARLLAILAAAPLAIPPIVTAMGFADRFDAGGFLPCAALLGTCYAPFVAVLAARGISAIDGRMYEAALLARGRARAETLLVRLAAPEIVAGMLLAFVFIVSEHGVVEFLTVKFGAVNASGGKSWHTYAEGIFSKWQRRQVGTDPLALASPIVASLPLLLVLVPALWAVLKLRARATVTGDHRPLPMRRFGPWRLPLAVLPALYLGLGLALPIHVMGAWASGTTQVRRPPSAEIFVESLAGALRQAGDDIVHTVLLAAFATAILVVVGTPLARLAARRMRSVEALALLPVAVPGILLAIGIVRTFNHEWAGGFVDGTTIVACAYATRFLPFVVLTLAAQVRRIPSDLEAAATMSGRAPWAIALTIHLPLLVPALWSAACLVFVLALRELDIAVLFTGGNGTVVRRLSNVVHFGGEDVGGALALMLILIAVSVPILTVLLTGRRMRPLS